MSEALFESAQAILQGCDTAMSQRWREEDRIWRKEDRQWRKQDMDWRVNEKHQMEAELEFIATQKDWRGQDVEQRVLDNARLMWNRAVETNRRAVEERAEQLKEVSNLSALIGGFALIAFLEFSFDLDEIPSVLVYGFGLTTALTVGLMLNSMVTCSFMHASILKTGRMYVSEADEAKFLYTCRDYAKNYTLGSRPPRPYRSFKQHWDERCEKEWKRAFYCFATGIPVFMLNLAFAGLIKFHEKSKLGIVIAVIVFVGFLIYLRSCVMWAPHLLYKEQDIFRDSLHFNAVGLPFDWHLIPISQAEMQLSNNRQLADAANANETHWTRQGDGEISTQEPSNVRDPESLRAVITNQPRRDSRRLRSYTPFRSLSLSNVIWSHSTTPTNDDQWFQIPNNLWTVLSEWFASWVAIFQRPSSASQQ